jgi:mRNA interferase YafQ
MSNPEKYRPIESGQFKRGRKLAQKQGLDLPLLKWGIAQLAESIPLPASWKDHPLKGDMKNFRECHIGGSGDWLLVYEKSESDMILYLVATGSHASVFGL